MTGHERGQGGGASPGDLKLSGVTLGMKEKVGGDKVENQELGAESLQEGLPVLLQGPESFGIGCNQLSGLRCCSCGNVAMLATLRQKADRPRRAWF